MSGTSEVQGYIRNHPQDVRERLEQLRAHVIRLVPEAEEKMAYGIPTYKMRKNIFHFAAYAKHIGLYPGAAAVAAHTAELSGYKTSKGTIQVAHTQPLPMQLIAQLIQFNLSQVNK